MTINRIFHSWILQSSRLFLRKLRVSMSSQLSCSLSPKSMVVPWPMMQILALQITMMDSWLLALPQVPQMQLRKFKKLKRDNKQLLMLLLMMMSQRSQVIITMTLISSSVLVNNINSNLQLKSFLAIGLSINLLQSNKSNQYKIMTILVQERTNNLTLQ